MDTETIVMILHAVLALLFLALAVFKGKSGVLYALTSFTALGWFLTYWNYSHYIAGAMLIMAAVTGFNAVKNI